MRWLLALSAVVGGLLVPAAAIGDEPGGRLVPAPSGPVTQVSTELNGSGGLGYAAFPVTVAMPDGTLLCAYKAGASHWGPTSQLMLRRSPDGVVWDDGVKMPLASGYAWGVSGLATETSGQGGRLYMSVLRQHYGTASQYTPDESRAWLYRSDDAGTTWSQGWQFPTSPGTYGFYPSSLAVLADGTVMAAGYTSDGYARYYTSTDRGQTWVAAGAFKAPENRTAAEPSLAQLPDGRVVSLVRSDAGTSQRLYVTTRNADGTWAPLWAATWDGSGSPATTVVNADTIVALYRGWADRTDPTRLPMRTLLMGVTPDGVRSWRGNGDMWPGQFGRYLYGNLVRSSTGWRVIASVEGPLGDKGASAQIVSIPVDFRPAP